MTTFNVGDRVRLVADVPMYRGSSGKSYESAAVEHGVKRGSVGVVRSQADGDGDVQVEWDAIPDLRWHTQTAQLERLADGDLVSAQAAAEFTATKLDTLAEEAANLIWGALHSPNHLWVDLNPAEIKTQLLKRVNKK